MNNNYNPFKLTAITRKNMSVPYRHEIKLIDKEMTVLDYGCGHGQDADMLIDDGYCITKYDKFNQDYNIDSILENKYDVVLCNYVLNVIPDLKTHNEVVELLRQLGDEIYISVRADKKAIKDNWIYDEFNMCYKTPKGSYQRFYDEDMVARLFGEVDFVVNNSTLKLFKLK